jgi:hypothetical protein
MVFIARIEARVDLSDLLRQGVCALKCVRYNQPRQSRAEAVGRHSFPLIKESHLKVSTICDPHSHR